MRKSATAIAIVALGAMLAAGSATESMAHGGGGGGGGGHGGGGDHGGGGHSFGGSRGDFGGGDHGSHGGGIFGRGIFGSDRGFATSHDRIADRRDHFRDFRRDDNYGYYFCEYPYRWDYSVDYCD
ncbi:hypothetical protein LJR231_001133 [Phyllobacterium sp. LjRoot231]|uniref:hypothetical protein n=1 Tax=Phyllobacterium sp. LjRoot231 TaxID=3342289 RepID=UPI003ECD9736